MLRAQLDRRAPLVVVLGRHFLRRFEDFVGGNAEPSIDAIADQLAAADEHEQGRDDRHREHRGDELRAKSREGHGLPPLEQFDEVPAKDEQERKKNREVNAPQRVEHAFVDERRRKLARAIGQPQQAHENREQQPDYGKKNARVVEGTAPRFRRRWYGVGRRRPEHLRRPRSRGQRMNVNSLRPAASS